MRDSENSDTDKHKEFRVRFFIQQPTKEKSEPNGKFRPTSNNGVSATKASANPFGNSNQSKQESTNPFEQTTLENTDPFAKNSTTIDIPDKDLPF